MTSPNYPAMTMLRLAIDALRANQPDEAEALFRKVLAHDPVNVMALYQLGLLAYNHGQRAEAEDLLHRAVAIEPANLQLLIAYGQLLHETGRSREALDVFLRALALQSSNAEVWNAAGICLQETGDTIRAVEFYLKALALQPEYPEAYNNLGVVLSREGDHAAAVTHFREALKLRPEFADCLANLGVALRSQLDYPAAIAAFRQALELSPESAEYAGSLGEVLGLIYHDDAEVLLRQAVAMRPADAEKHYNLAAELLKQGKYTEGWREYEWRWKRTRDQTPLPAFAQPFWRGEPGQELRGTTILLHAEQGFGDTIQFLRYVPLLLEQGARVVLQVPPALHRLTAEYAAGLDAEIVVTPHGDPLPELDWHIPLMSLPAALGTTLESIPPPVRFTRRVLPAPEDIQAQTQPLRIGFAWAGNPLHARDRERSIPFTALRPLFEQPGCTWVSLQTGPPAAQWQHAGVAVEQPPLNDFADTAAVIDTLDLVICVDTAVAHLAASQGVPTWILLPFVSDWRWLRPPQTMGSTATPWYPDARVFRQWQLPVGQTQAELWQPVIAHVAEELHALAESRRPGALP